MGTQSTKTGCNATHTLSMVWASVANCSGTADLTSVTALDTTCKPGGSVGQYQKDQCVSAKGSIAGATTGNIYLGTGCMGTAFGYVAEKGLDCTHDANSSYYAKATCATAGITLGANCTSGCGTCAVTNTPTSGCTTLSMGGGSGSIGGVVCGSPANIITPAAFVVALLALLASL